VHLDLVLQRLREHQLYAKLSKCAFALTDMPFLGHIISAGGIRMDPAKVDAIMQWPVPRTVVQLQSFPGLANDYRRFVKDYSKIATPLTELATPATKDWPWGEAQDAAFAAIKAAIASAPVIHMPNLTQPVVVTTDASNFAIGAVLSQGSGADERVIAFESKKMTAAETRYPVHDKEMLAVVYALKKNGGTICWAPVLLWVLITRVWSTLPLSPTLTSGRLAGWAYWRSTTIPSNTGLASSMLPLTRLAAALTTRPPPSP
jgi:RNase H-like domain found in reverse transcriptase